MATRAATCEIPYTCAVCLTLLSHPISVTAKIGNLRDYHSRLLHNVSPLPSGLDIANTLKHFSQTLLSVLKDVPFIPSESYTPRQRDSVRLSMFPNLNYSGLYEAVLNIIDVIPTVLHGQDALGESVLTVLSCLVPFLEYDQLNLLPYTIASTLATFPASLQPYTVQLLCTTLLPVTFDTEEDSDDATYATEATAAILMIVLQQVDQSEQHAQLIECLMGYKKNICKDLLSVIAYGPPSARAPATHHLFHHWPQLRPASDWEPTSCQRERCLNSGNVKAVKMCLDPGVAIENADKPPPIHLCVDCVDQLRHDEAHNLVDILQPMGRVALVCDNKNCTSKDKTAVCSCFSLDCASLNGFRPVRYCQQCHTSKHADHAPGAHHMYHASIPDVWSCDPDLRGYIVEAIVSLLKEAIPLEDKRQVEMGEERVRPSPHFLREEEEEEDDNEEDRKLLSRYGVWLLVSLAPPKDNISIEILGRLLAMLFQWFDATAYLPDDSIGSALERLKPMYLQKWLQEVSKRHFEVVLSCLLPHPPEYARVGGYWDTLSSRTCQIKEGLNRLFCLVPYNIVTFQVWDYVMPFWLEAIRTEVPESDKEELKVLLCKLFDNDMSPLPFSVEKMYHFITERFDDTEAIVQEQNLSWLQIMASLEILTPVRLLLSMFRHGIDSLAAIAESEAEIQRNNVKQNNNNDETEEDGFPMGSPLACKKDASTAFPFDITSDVNNVNCFVMMLDLILAQIELQDATAHLGVFNDTCRDIMCLLTRMLRTPFGGKHTCEESDAPTHACTRCAMTALWHQLASKCLLFVSPRDEISLPVKELPRVEEIQMRSKSMEKHASDAEKSTEIAEPDFDVKTLPMHLQLLYAQLKCLSEECDADALYFLLHSIRLLCLHGEAVNYCLPEYIHVIEYCLKELMIPDLWKLLQAEHSQVSTMAVPLLLYCLTLPSGADIFWRLVEDDFNCDDWRIRFAAVEKVTMIARLTTSSMIEHNQQIRTSLAHAFCYLIGSLDDVNSSVVQRATLYLDTLKMDSVQCMCACLEFQFDSVISDRTMILRKMHVLSVILKQHQILSWTFFLNRFDALCLEAQLDVESQADVSSFQDLTSSDRHSDHFLRKINRARFALARTDSVRSLCSSYFTKPPYRRAASVPMHLLMRTLPNQNNPKAPLLAKAHAKAQGAEEDKSPYTRQQSAPQFRSRGSRFGIGMFTSYMFPALSLGFQFTHGGHLREYTDGESKFASLLQRAMDLDGVDRETLHHLVSLLMKFMVTVNQDVINEDPDLSKAQNVVLRHLNVLLGYNQTEKSFSVPPYKLRYSAVFNAYISGLPQVLDQNFELGNMILAVSMMLLQYCPSPQRYASDYQPPNYTLWYLEPHTRQSWLTSLLIILYKYQYNTSPASGIVEFLVRLTINTIDAQLHHCKRSEEAFGPASPMVPRHRDISNASIGDLGDIIETDTPPQSPTDESCVSDAITISTASAAQYQRQRDGQSLLPPRTQSPPLPTSPTSSIPASPAAGSPEEEIFRPPKLRAKLPLASASETMALRQHDQPRRIAEYNRDSFSGEEMNQRTLEQSVDEYLHGKSSAHLTSGPQPQDVDQKIQEQIQEFECENQKKKTTTDPSNDDELPVAKEITAKEINAEVISEFNNTHCHTHILTLDRFEKPFEVLEEVKESEEENGSPKKKEENEQEIEEKKSIEEEKNEQTESDLDDSPDSQPKLRPNFRQRKARKTGLTTIELQKMIPELSDQNIAPTSPQAARRSRRSDLISKSAQSQQKQKSLSAMRANEQIMVDRCPDCNAVLESYDEETISLAVVCLATFIHREPGLAAPCLLDMLITVARSGLIIPGNCVSVARQFLRCVLHQMAPNGIFPQIFMHDLGDTEFLKTLASALVDFSELNCHNALLLLLEGVNDMKTVTSEQMMLVVSNLSTFMDYVAMETASPAWNNILLQLDIFFRRLPLLVPANCDMETVLKIIICTLKIPGLSSVKSLLESFSKLLSYTLQCCSFNLQQLLDICSLCSRAFTKERDKIYLTRSIIFELVQALKFKTILPDENLVLLVQFVCLDAGGTLGPISFVPELANYTYNPYSSSLVSTNAADCMKPHLSECLEFVADLHTINKVKNNYKEGSQSLNEDTLGNHLKAGVAQFIATELTRANGRDQRALSRCLPWLYHPPSAMQQGPREFTDCVGHIRLLSWVLLGSLTHTAVTKGSANILVQPLPLETSAYIADHIMVIMTGFAEQSKLSVLHMSSLFHAFIHCQLWTIYCETFAMFSAPGSDSHMQAHTTIMDFWGRVTPGVLQLLSHSKVVQRVELLKNNLLDNHFDDVTIHKDKNVKQLAEMVNLHFLNLMEALQECNSLVLSKMFPMWAPILFSYHNQLPGHMQVRLQMCQNWEPRDVVTDASQLDSDNLRQWLQRLQFKLGQIEVQSSAVTQFYTI
ncbi:hypothetical protein CAPTEDRAFT_227700 [Capitella teleta]|uniref:Uncharacterized protein n=1 Tax=Capitella teleta TaxID=283909 RepID=R7UY84_CAPTE|nr:hypothetical protein CAPTEDRAFT_227700 [Capitella teleta]|eukprot:ELU08396.1 hypothetical protein CAPTEDRAFT_227700 [Capitella teleta]